MKKLIKVLTILSFIFLINKKSFADVNLNFAGAGALITQIQNNYIPVNSTSAPRVTAVISIINLTSSSVNVGINAVFTSMIRSTATTGNIITLPGTTNYPVFGNYSSRFALSSTDSSGNYTNTAINSGSFVSLPPLKASFISIDQALSDGVTFVDGFILQPPGTPIGMPALPYYLSYTGSLTIQCSQCTPGNFQVSGTILFQSNDAQNAAFRAWNNNVQNMNVEKSYTFPINFSGVKF